MTRQSLSYSLFRTIHRAKRRIDVDVRRILMATPSVVLAVASVLFLAALISLMAVAK